MILDVEFQENDMSFGSKDNIGNGNPGTGCSDCLKQGGTVTGSVHFVSGTKRVVVDGNGVSVGDDEIGDGVTLAMTADENNLPAMEVRTNVDAQLARMAVGDPAGANDAVTKQAMERYVESKKVPEYELPVANPDTLGGVQPVEKTEAMTNPVGVDALGGLWSSSDIPRIELSDSVATIEPNKFYVFPEMASLSISFGGVPNASIVQEYKFRFTSGNAATTLVLPSDVKGDIAVPVNSVIEISVIDNYAVSQSWVVN
jgi:hypothetical protein